MLAAFRSYAWLGMGIVAIVAIWYAYHLGYSSAQAIGAAKLADLESSYNKAEMAEMKRQADANAIARRASQEAIERIQRERTSLQEQIKQMAEEADADPNAQRIGINSDAAKRIGSVK